MPDHRDVEPTEVEQLGGCRIAETGLQVGGIVCAAGELHDMRIAVAGGQLHQAKPVAMGREPHGLGVDRDAIAELDVGRQIALV